MKKLYIKTYGCQMNVYDSVRMADVLAPLGYTSHDTVEGADLIILNTCHIREKAEEKVFSELGRIRKQKMARPETLIAVGGCVAQAEGAEIMKRAPYVDFVFGSQAYHELPGLVTRALAGQKGEVALDFPEMPKFDHLPRQIAGQGVAAFVAVQEGCDKFCTFCVVPYTRGAEYSRNVADVVQEVAQLVAKGAQEVMLLGQNVNAYHGVAPDGQVWSLAQLIHDLAKMDGLSRIRYITSHPRDMQEDLLQAHATVDKLMPYLHLPIQSGSNEMLKRMNRKHTNAEYINIIERLRAMRPDMAFSGDFIVGFPGETESDFEDTLALVRHVGYASAYSFKYSPRPGTPAATMADQVPEEVKDERLQRLQAALMEQSRAFNRSCVGTEMDVLFDRQGKLPGQLVGRSPYLQSVHVNGVAEHMGQMVRVRITQATANSLAGELISDNTQQATYPMRAIA